MPWEDSGDSSRPVVTQDIAAEAAVWVARLHGPDRSRRMERECLAWQARSPVHREAFERCTDTWQEVGRLSLSDCVAAGAGRRGATPGLWSSLSPRWSLALMLAVVGVVGLAMHGRWGNVDTYATGVGEQRTVVLADGTRMSLNTATRVLVELSSRRRSVRMEGGEALFEVAKDRDRPFVVRADASEVEAIGTVFAVRKSPEGAQTGVELSVSLIEGRVAVRPAGGSPETDATLRAVVLGPGDRLRLVQVRGSPSGGTGRLSTSLDRPRVTDIIAWRRNEVHFDDVSLSEAVAEMNRYSRTPIVLVGGEAVGGRRISGLFRTGDSATFARAAATLHGLVLRGGAERLEIGPE